MSSAQPKANPDRLSARESVFVAGTLTADGVTVPMKVLVRNLSPGGMMIDCTAPLGKGQHVLVNLRGIGEVKGVIAWATRGRVGVTFEREIDPKLVRKPVTADAAKKVLPIAERIARQS